MRVTTLTTGLTGLLASSGLTTAIDLDTTSPQSILSASKIVVSNVLSIYNQNGTGPEIPGVLPRPYYFWEAGLMFDSLINYWSYSNDSSLIPTIQQGMLFQVGPENNYLPPNQTKSLGNDDQAVWGNAAMTAAELGFPMPSNSNITWQQLATNVFNAIAARWDTETCGGGLRWQIFTFNNGYNYKNSASLASFAQLAGRLYRFTGNETYSDWAQKAVEWGQSVGLIDSETGQVFDGTDTNLNCTELNHIQWTCNYGWLLGTAAHELNVSSTRFWNGLSFALLTNANETFTWDSSNVLQEIACEPNNNCNVDQLAFKSVLARGLARTAALTMDANYTSNGTSAGTVNSGIKSILDDSAKAAAAQCTGGQSGTRCGSNWYETEGQNDGNFGLGQELNALEVFLGTLPAKELRRSNGTSSMSTSGNGNGNGTRTQSSTSGSATPNSAAALSMSMLSSMVLGIGLAGTFLVSL